MMRHQKRYSAVASKANDNLHLAPMARIEVEAISLYKSAKVFAKTTLFLTSLGLH